MTPQANLTLVMAGIGAAYALIFAVAMRYRPRTVLAFTAFSALMGAAMTWLVVLP